MKKRTTENSRANRAADAASTSVTRAAKSAVVPPAGSDRLRGGRSIGKEETPPETPGWVASLSPRVENSLFEARTILLFGEINQRVAASVAEKLVALAAVSDKPITLFLNSQGGHVEAGDTIHDLLGFVEPSIRIIGTGWVASAGAHIYLAVPREDRFCLPNTRFMLHQPHGGVYGQAVDIGIEAQEIIRMRKRLNETIARQTGQPLEKVEKDTDRNYWMSAEAAVEYGVVGRIIESVREIEGG